MDGLVIAAGGNGRPTGAGYLERARCGLYSVVVVCAELRTSW